MPKILDELVETKQVTLYKADLEFLRTLYGNNIGVNAVLRTIVRAYVNKIKVKAESSLNIEFE